MPYTASIHHLCAWSITRVAVARPSPRNDSGPHSQGLCWCMATMGKRLFWMGAQAGGRLPCPVRSYPELDVASNAMGLETPTVLRKFEPANGGTVSYTRGRAIRGRNSPLSGSL